MWKVEAHLSRQPRTPWASHGAGGVRLLGAKTTHRDIFGKISKLCNVDEIILALGGCRRGHRDATRRPAQPVPWCPVLYAIAGQRSHCPKVGTSFYS